MHKGTQVDGQIELSDLFKKELSITPQFQKGQPVFFRSLDVVLEGTINSFWLCDLHKSENPFYGYDAVIGDGFCRTFWDKNIGDTVFFEKELAQNAARKAEKSLEKFHPDTNEMHEVVGFSYIRGLDGHKLTACLAKVGDTQIYEHEFYCYHFLRTYKNQKERDRAFKKLNDKIQSEAKKNSSVEVTPVFETLYFVNGIYASREYVENHASLMRT